MESSSLRLPTLVEVSLPDVKVWSSALAAFPDDSGFLVSYGSSIWHITPDFKLSRWAGQIMSDGWTSDGEKLEAATFLDPTGIVFVGADVYIVDRADNCIRKVSNGNISTYAGVPGKGRKSTINFAFSSPHHAVEHDSRLYVSNSGKDNIVVLNLLQNTVECIIGNDAPVDGSWGKCTFKYPIGLAVNKSTNTLYIADADGCALQEADLSKKNK